MKTKRIYQKYFKRGTDLTISFFCIIILSPLFLVLAFLIRINLGSPIIFVQERPGKNEKIFTMYKFRTMNERRDKNGNLLADHIRITKFGKFLRASSLDELPELVNILKGDMSLIGPRPLLPEYLSLYTSSQRLRHNVRPGLTGLAQVNGRNSITWKDKFKFDIEYVNNISFKNDLKIFVKTISKVIHRDGITDSNNVSMEKFDGNN